MDAVTILDRLIAFDTSSARSNLEAVDWLAGLFDGGRASVERNTSADGSKANLHVRIGPAVDPATRPGVALCGHLDTVPAIEPGWESDPFRLTDRGDRWVGRGTADMKGFVAIATALALETDPADLGAPLALLFTYDEEVGSLGAQRFLATHAERESLPRPTVVGEPTSLEAVRLHKGHLRLRLDVHGESAHGGTPHRGRNAVTAAARAVSALEALAEELAAERPPYGEHFPEVPWVALNVGTISGGTAVNVVPDLCAVGFGLRPLPGMEGGPLVERARRAIAPAVGDLPWELVLVNESPPLLVAAEVPLYKEICDLVGQTESRSAPFSSDGGVLSRAGQECVLWGPGSIGVAHRPNEWIAKDELERGGRLLQELVHRLCRKEAA